jgi:hypothetical protein
MHRNDIFFIFLKLFLRLTHQIDPKYIKKLIFNKKLNFYGTRFARVSKQCLNFIVNYIFRR